MPMDPYQPYIEAIDRLRAQMVRQVEMWARINSGSYHKEGLARMCDTLQEEFSILDGEMTVLDCDPMTRINGRGELVTAPLGQLLQIVKRPGAALKVLLCGHMDTVFDRGHPFQDTRLLNDNRLNGPGVADLKGGLVVMLAALRALEQSPFAEKIGWEVVITPDEEIGSPGSAPHLAACARRNHLGLVYEPTLPEDRMAAARKGSGNFTVVVRGRAAHAGREYEKGRNAITALAEYTQALNALNGRREGVTINPGRVQGGGAVNIVPDLAILDFNVRMATPDEQLWLEEHLAGLEHPFNGRDGIELRRHGGFSRPPKTITAENEKLMAAVTRCGRMLGLSLVWQATGGCCDGNNLAAAGLPNVDTMGVRGGNIHSEREYLVLDSLVERAKLSALLLMQLANKEVDI